jgi:hypothetical protein
MNTVTKQGNARDSQPCMTESVARQLIVAAKSQHDDLKNIIVKMIDGRAWKALGHNSFKAMCDAEIPCYSYSYLTKIKQAYEIHVEIKSKEDFGKIPEHYYRELKKVPKDQRVTVWNEAIQAAGGLDALTIQHISAAAMPYLPEPKAKQPAHQTAASIDRSALTAAENYQLDKGLERMGIKYEDLDETKVLRKTAAALVPSMQDHINPVKKRAKRIGETLGENLIECEVTSEAAKELCIRRLLDIVAINIRKGVEVTQKANGILDS